VNLRARWVGLSIALVACGVPPAQVPGPKFSPVDRSDQPLPGLNEKEAADFATGDELFGLPLHEYDGLGPLYTESSCGSCHEGGARGPGLVQKMALVESDGFTPLADQSALAFGHTVHPRTAGGGTTPILPPTLSALKLTRRVGQSVMGRGSMEAVLDSEIERVAAEQAAAGGLVSGRVNYVVYGSEANPDTRVHRHQKGDRVIGRFGLKARIATLDDFAADALQKDMGITSPMRPQELINPDGLLDDRKPGIDLTIESVNLRANYLRHLRIPRRAVNEEGRAIFATSPCASCHVPSLHTRSDYPIAQLADREVEVFTDFLLHDMGDGLADGMVDEDGTAGPREWRTAALIGLRFNDTFLHDGRAKSVEQAISFHGSNGSEAADALRWFNILPPSERQALLEFVNAL
jgi:CxxC motif-containing protein (DUF1111 family)